MSLQNRPYIGSWSPNRTLVRHSPDCRVFINGYQEFATCPTCNNTLDLQKYITSVTADGTVEPIANATVSLSIPRHNADIFCHDGNYVLQTNLEVVILMRGYFPMKNFGGQGQTPEEGFDGDNVPMYPYYQVFRGVVTSVSHEFSGGFYSATLQCSNLLHFWQNLKLSVNGAVFGSKPDNSMVTPSLVGHKFTGSNPYSIIYTLVKVGFGAAYGVDFQISKKSSVAAKADDQRTSLYAHAGSWWQKRWTEHSGNLRMYGVTGQIFNIAQQAYLGAWYDSRNAKGGGTLFKTAKTLLDGQEGKNDYDPKRLQSILSKARELGYDPYLTSAAIYDTSGEKGETTAREDTLKMQAFNLDIGKMGALNMFETEYMSKMEIAEAVKKITGYEFYQDVDGDLVFKPPMYNLDTRDDPVFRIADRDLISITETESEPECTVMKGTGSQMANISGTGLEGWLGVGGLFIDYRLVAKYGYKEDTFESNFVSSRHALYISAINRLDIANVGVKSASITIPLRPELRPGYPIYIEHLDCFYYVNSFSHTFTFGGQCTTAIQGVAKRAKWMPPMATKGDGRLPSIDQVRLDAPDEYPSQPLYGFPNLVSGSSTEGDAGPMRMYGFPNVVLAMDPEQVKMTTLDIDTGLITSEAFVQIALESGFLEEDRTTPDMFILRTTNLEGTPISLTEVQQQWTEITVGGKVNTETNTELGSVLAAIRARSYNVDVTNPEGLVNYLSLQTSLKGLFSPGTTSQGKYRYYSCSHYKAENQAPANFSVNQETGGPLSYDIPGPPDEGFSKSNIVIKDVDPGTNLKGIKTEEAQTVRGIKIASLSQKAGTGETTVVYQIVSTADVRFVTFGPQMLRKKLDVSVVTEGSNKGANFLLDKANTTSAFKYLLGKYDTDQSSTIEERFSIPYDVLIKVIDTYSSSLGVSGNSSVASVKGKVSTVGNALDNYPPTYPTKKSVSTTYHNKASRGKAATDYVSTKVVNSKTSMGKGSGSLTITELSKKYSGYNSGDSSSMGKLAEVLAAALWNYLGTVQSTAQKLKGFKTNYEEYMKARATFIESYTNGEVDVPDSTPGTVSFMTQEYNDKGDFTPIFPVSDAGGYEVYGNLPYGRGLNIEVFSDLMQATTSGNQNEGATEAASSSVTSVGARGGANASDLVAIEQFLILLMAKGFGEASSILAEFSDTGQAAILASLNTVPENIQAAVETLNAKDTSQAAKVRNSPVTSFDRGQSVYGDVASTNLAYLDVTTGLCKCKGADASFLVNAYSEKYVELYPSDPMQGYLEEQAASVGQGWKASRDALAGRVFDTRNTNLAEQFTLQGDIASAYVNDSTSAINQLKQAGEKASQAAKDLEEDL